MLVNGSEEDVRYIGVDTPESVAPDAAGRVLRPRGEPTSTSAWSRGEKVRLEFDAERRDVYGRLLAYVYVGDLFVNAELVREGYATTLTIAAQRQLRRALRPARAGGRKRGPGALGGVLGETGSAAR